MVRNLVRTKLKKGLEFVSKFETFFKFRKIPFFFSVGIQTVSVFSLFCFPFCILAHFDPIVRRTVGIFKFILFIFLF